MRVCLLTVEMAPLGGGIGTYTAALWEVLRDVAEVTVVTREEHRGVIEGTYPDLDVAYVPPGDEQAWSAAAVDVIADHYRGRGPDLVETSDFLGLAHGPLAARAAGSPALRSTRIVVRVHTTSEISDVLDGIDISTPYKTGLHAMERSALLAADRLLWGYGDVLGTYRRFYGRAAIARPFKLRHPVQAADVEISPYDDDTLHVVYVGRLERRKGVQDLLAALLRDETRRWHLDLFGGDTDTGPGGASMLETLQAMAPGDERVRYQGARPRHEVDSALARADLMALPSKWECAAYTVLEAMRVGCPVLATPVGGMTELIDPGVTGVLARGTGPDAVATALAPLIRDPGRARKLRASGAPQRHLASLTEPGPIRAGFAELGSLPLTPRPIPQVTAPGREPRRMRWVARRRGAWPSWSRGGANIR